MNAFVELSALRTGFVIRTCFVGVFCSLTETGVKRKQKRKNNESHLIVLQKDFIFNKDVDAFCVFMLLCLK